MGSQLLLVVLACNGALALAPSPRVTTTVVRSPAAVAAAPVADASRTPGGVPGKERHALDARLFSLNVAIVDTVKGAIDIAYKKNPYARFFVLETVARVPYFAYLSVMHLKETFGARDDGLVERMRVHYAEADNELHHLLIMESLGGNSSAIDRTVAQTMAFFYYWYVVMVYTLSQPVSQLTRIKTPSPQLFPLTSFCLCGTSHSSLYCPAPADRFREGMRSISNLRGL
jgi:hypothetical protein